MWVARDTLRNTSMSTVIKRVDANASLWWTATFTMSEVFPPPVPVAASRPFSFVATAGQLVSILLRSLLGCSCANSVSCPSGPALEASSVHLCPSSIVDADTFLPCF